MVLKAKDEVVGQGAGDGRYDPGVHVGGAAAHDGMCIGSKQRVCSSAVYLQNAGRFECFVACPGPRVPKLRHGKWTTPRLERPHIFSFLQNGYQG